MRTLLILAVAIPILGGCFVVVDDHRPPPSHARTAVVAYNSSWHDLRYVVWREYYDCDDYDIYYCESLYGYDEDDLLVLLFISRFCHLPIRTVVYQYDHHHRDLFSVALYYRMTGHEFFVASVQPGYCPPPYGHAYGYYWKREHGYRLTNEEVRALVHLRIGVEYYGYRPHDYFREHENYRAQGHAHCFRQVAVRDYQKAGSGGKNIHQVTVKKTDRPWEVSDRGQWEKRREDAREKARVRESSEPPRHPEAEKARKQFEEARKEDAARRQREEAQKKAADEAQRRKLEEDQRRKAEEERRKADEDRRRKAEEDQRRKAEEERRKADEDRRRRAEEDQRRAAEDQRRKQEDQKKQDQKKQEDRKPDKKKP